MPKVFFLSPMWHMILLAVLAHLVLAGVRFTSSLYVLSMRGSSLMVGSIIALFALLPMLLAVPAGRWLDAVGLRRPLFLGTLAICTGSALMLSGWPNLFYLAAVLVGSGFMLLHIASQKLVGHVSHDAERASNYSWLALGFSTSGFLAPVLAGVLIDHLSHRFAFGFFFMVSVLLLCLVSVGKLHRVFAVPEQRPIHQGGAIDLFWRNKKLREIYIIGILLASAWESFTFITPILGTQRALSASAIGMVLGMFSLATFLIRFLIPFIQHLCTEWQMMMMVFVITALCLAGLPWVEQAWSMMLLAFILGLGLGASQPNMLSLLHQAAPAERGGEAIGIRVTVGNASQVALPLAFGVAGASVGLLSVFLTMSALVACGLPLVWRRAFP